MTIDETAEPVAIASANRTDCGRGAGETALASHLQLRTRGSHARSASGWTPKASAPHLRSATALEGVYLCTVGREAVPQNEGCSRRSGRPARGVPGRLGPWAR